MSSTNRGSKRKENDFYSTPKEALDPILPHLPKTVEFWEPAAGDGRLILWLRESGRTAWGIDLNHGFVAWMEGEAVGIDKSNQGRDFLDDKTPRQFIITNPPFSLAQEFVTHSLEVADETMLLLRLNFLGAQKRRDWWKTREPDAIFVLSNRPDFTGDGGDSCEYGWFYWGHRYQGIKHP